MKGTPGSVRTRLRSPSVLNASSVPTPGKSISSGSESASRTTTCPCSTSRAGRVYSSSTSMGENPALYSKGQRRTSGRPPTYMSIRSQTSSCAAPHAASMLLIPGATPAS
jgi:hypothetical protein